MCEVKKNRIPVYVSLYSQSHNHIWCCIARGFKIPRLHFKKFTLSVKILRGHSSQVFHSWPKCWEKPTMYSHQIRTFYVLPFSRHCSSKLTIFFLLQCSHYYPYFSVTILPVTWQKINFRKGGWIHLKSSLFTVLTLYFVLTTLPKMLIESYKQEVTFFNFAYWQVWQNFLRGKSVSKGQFNLSYLGNGRS